MLLTATRAAEVRADVATSMRLSVPPLTASVAAAMARDEEFPAWLAGLPHERLAMQQKIRKVHSSVALQWQRGGRAGTGLDSGLRSGSDQLRVRAVPLMCQCKPGHCAKAHACRLRVSVCALRSLADQLRHKIIRPPRSLLAAVQ